MGRANVPFQIPDLRVAQRFRVSDEPSITRRAV
jgi:hypothetical protein